MGNGGMQFWGLLTSLVLPGPPSAWPLCFSDIWYLGATHTSTAFLYFPKHHEYQAVVDNELIKVSMVVMCPYVHVVP
jgi:hypothetical protein